MAIYIQSELSQGYSLAVFCEEEITDEQGNTAICGTTTTAPAEVGDDETSRPDTLYAGDVTCEKCGTKYHDIEKSFY